MMKAWPRRDTRGSTSVEFAVVGMALCLITFGIIEAGLLFWVKTGMQLTAAMTARCGAIGYTYSNANNIANFACTNTSTTQNYAVSTIASTWSLTGITTSDVTLNGTNGKVTTCNGFTGNFFSVSLSHSFTNLPPPFGNISTLSTTACYPMP
jgi:Flp pilus assembly protein TadG